MISNNYVPDPGDGRSPPGFLVFDTESVPDGKLLHSIKYAPEELTPHECVVRAQDEQRRQSSSGSDFIPVTFHYPVATCVLRVGADYTLQNLRCLDAPHFRPRKIVEQFWAGVVHYREKHRDSVKLVTFNGRCFDLPLMELAAFRYGVGGRDHFNLSRKRFEGWHLDLMDWMTNYSAFRLTGGLNLLSKLLGKPGKMDVKGDMVYAMYQDGKVQEINDYCMFDTLDTYFVLLRTRVLTGELTLAEEHRAVLRAREWLQEQVKALPALQTYLDNWGDWHPWP
jgi:predicted PolB exonuclease-like 3'-5' exonuclease